MIKCREEKSREMRLSSVECGRVKHDAKQGKQQEKALLFLSLFWLPLSVQSSRAKGQIHATVAA